MWFWTENLGPQLTFFATTITQLRTVSGEEKVKGSYESVKQPIIIIYRIVEGKNLALE